MRGNDRTRGAEDNDAGDTQHRERRNDSKRIVFHIIEANENRMHQMGRRTPTT